MQHDKVERTKRVRQEIVGVPALISAGGFRFIASMSCLCHGRVVDHASCSVNADGLMPEWSRS